MDKAETLRRKMSNRDLEAQYAPLYGGADAKIQTADQYIGGPAGSGPLAYPLPQGPTNPMLLLLDLIRKLGLPSQVR